MIVASVLAEAKVGCLSLSRHPPPAPPGETLDILVIFVSLCLLLLLSSFSSFSFSSSTSSSSTSLMMTTAGRFHQLKLCLWSL